MPSLILGSSQSGNPIIFFGAGSWERGTQKGSSSNAVQWRVRTGHLSPVDRPELADLLEHIFRNPDEVSTIDDSPKLDDDDTAFSAWSDTYIATLDAAIVRGIAQRREAKIEIGRAFNKQKRLLGHGKFKCHVSDVHGSLISLRTAERYMKFGQGNGR